MQSLTKILIPRQLFMLLVLSSGLLNHVILIPNLLKAAGRDSWLSVIVAYLISLIFLWLIYFIVRNSPNDGFYSLIRKRLGRAFSIVFSIPVILFLFTSSYVTFRDFMIWLKSYFLVESSVFMINFILICACCAVTLAGVKSMAISSGFLLPLVALFGFFIAFTNTNLKDPSLLFPLLADGYPPLIKGVMYVLSGLLEIYIVVLLQPFSQETIKFRQLFILLTIITGLIFGPLSAAIMEFGPTEAMRLQYPAYEQWRILSMGDYISHLDFFALYQWLSGGLIRIGLFMYLIGAFFSNTMKHYKLNSKLVVVIYLALFGMVTVNIETYSFYKIIYQFFLPACMVYFLIQILLSALILFVIKKRDERRGKNKRVESTS